MIKEGMYARCPIDFEHPDNPRVFATGKVKSINTFNETAHIVFLDPFNYRALFESTPGEYIPKEVKEAPLKLIEHCNLFKNSKVKSLGKDAIIVEYKTREDEGYDYYLRDIKTREYSCVAEEKIEASFFSGFIKPSVQLSKYEFQNPSWYLGRQIVKDTMSILDNSIYGFKELAGCKIYLKAFQINTIMRCLQSDCCRYMIADEVGLGKTIEACSVLKIYMKNKSNQNILISAPAALIPQWRTELLFKFGLLDGINPNGNEINLIAVEELCDSKKKIKWDFVIVDEVHNYLGVSQYYDLIHEISKHSKNILLLSATPIQQRREEYLKLLQLVIPEKYDDITLDTFDSLMEKQNKITRLTHELLDDIDSFQNELLPGIESNTYDQEDIQDEIEAIKDVLDLLTSLIEDKKLRRMIDNLDFGLDDYGIYDIKVIASYICDNYQIEKNIIRGRRAVLGVYPKDEEGEFSERKLIELEYHIDENTNYYENESYRLLKEWILNHQEKMDRIIVERDIKPLLESFFSSPWSFYARLKEMSHKLDIPESVIKSAKRWIEEEDGIIENMADILDDIDVHPSRIVLLLHFIDTELFGKKVVLFTDQPETFDVYFKVLKMAYGEEVAGFSKSMNTEEAEINIYRFQSDKKCNILICDKSGGEGRNLQMADYVIHIDLPWNINSIEQRIGRLDRMGRNIEIPVTSVVIHTVDSYEEQLFNLWNNGLSVFSQSLSGLEIIMNDINNRITDSISSDFEFGLYSVVPDLVNESKAMRETVQKEQIFDTAALRFKPLYNQLKRLLNDYQFNENELFSSTMMSWASLAGFEAVMPSGKQGLVTFDENNFHVSSARNSFLIPPNWDNYLSKKQNEMEIRVQRGVEEKKKNVSHDNRRITGTFDRDVAIKNDYIHFYAPGDEIFDCITDNAMHSYRGMSSAFAALSSINWKGFVYTFSIEPNERLLLDKGVSLFSLGLFRQYLATSVQTIAVSLSNPQDVAEKIVLDEHKRIVKKGYFNKNDDIEHLGKRGMDRDGGFLGISRYEKTSNLDWFKSKHHEDEWENFVSKSSAIARKRAKERFQKESNLSGAKEMIEQTISTIESRAIFYGMKEDSLEELKKQYDIIYESLSKPIIRMESACYMWLVKRNG